MVQTLEQEITISVNDSHITGALNVPEKAKALVLFAHGSGSSRFSKRNNYVADSLQKAGYATLLFDLLTAKEEQCDLESREYRFDIELLAERVKLSTDWVLNYDQTKTLPIAYFGASTGAAAALVAAGCYPDDVYTVISRGGRPDLANTALKTVQQPVLLIVGGEDRAVIELNQRARMMLKNAELKIVPGATHLFEEPGKLDEVIQISKEWLQSSLSISSKKFH